METGSPQVALYIMESRVNFKIYLGKAGSSNYFNFDISAIRNIIALCMWCCRVLCYKFSHVINTCLTGPRGLPRGGGILGDMPFGERRDQPPLDHLGPPIDRRAGPGPGDRRDVGPSMMDRPDLPGLMDRREPGPPMDRRGEFGPPMDRRDGPPLGPHEGGPFPPRPPMDRLDPGPGPLGPPMERRDMGPPRREFERRDFGPPGDPRDMGPMMDRPGPPMDRRDMPMDRRDFPGPRGMDPAGRGHPALAGDPRG